MLTTRLCGVSCAGPSTRRVWLWAAPAINSNPTLSPTLIARPTSVRLVGWSGGALAVLLSACESFTAR